TTKAYKEGSKKKRSLIGEQYYAEFSTEFWKDPGAQQHPNAVTPSTSSNTPSRRQPSRIPRAIPSPNRSRPTTPSLSRPPSSGSRPVTPSFSQSAETINIYINYNEPDQDILGRKHVIPDKKPIPVQRHDHITHQPIDIANIITNILGPPSSIRRPDFLKIPEHPRGLELDIYYPQYGFAIESSIMAQTAGQLLGQTVPVCQWTPQNIPNTTSTLSAHPKFPNNVREWIGFFRAVRLNNLPPGQFPIHATSAVPLRIEDEAKTRLHTNVLFPVESLFPQGSSFIATPIGFLGASDFVLCDNNFTVAKMPVEMKTRHNLDLRGYNFWQIYRYNDRRGIMNQRFGDPRFDQNFKFKKRILSQIFGQMACNGLHYAILSNYSDTYFLKREEANQTALYISRVVQTNDVNPTLRECVYYISQLAINDNVGNILGSVELDNYSSNDDSDDSRKRKRKSKSSSIPIASSSKGITTVDKYIGGGSFGKVFSGYYDNQNVAWKTCDAYKEQEQMKTLKHEAHIYSILKECQGRDIPRLFYNGYIYDGYLFALALQLIEGAYHVDPERLTKEEKKLIVNQLKSIHNCGVLHNDISEQNILYEPKSRHYFFIDFGLSEVDYTALSH
ncbi:17483_t:CDS:2, partial [Funneliformis geosporum]